MTLGIIQARMGSSRLPGKSMQVLHGKPGLGWVISRLRECRALDHIAVATTERAEDDVIADYCRANGVDCYRGSQNDVLDRYYRCAEQYHPEAVVRITGDCPLIDPEVVDQCIVLYHNQEGTDCYVSNCVMRTYPDGLDVEVFPFGLLERAWTEAVMASEREHVTLYIRERWPNIHLIHPEGDYSHVRLTLDHPEDAKVIDTILGALYPVTPDFRLEDMLRYLALHPEISALNAHFDPNEGLKKSLQEDRQVYSVESGEEY